MNLKYEKKTNKTIIIQQKEYNKYNISYTVLV